jgi:peptide-methionine (S)-S-oxide reductase
MSRFRHLPVVVAMLLAGSIAGPSSAAAPPNRETAVLAGGCFWGMEGVFEHVRGVTDAVSGYAGGRSGQANYTAVSGERTGHAEAVRITYDPRQVSYSQLLWIFMAVAHDPTQLNRQGPDEGPSYRSAIFPQDARQAAVARAFLAKASDKFSRPVVTRIETGRFYPAEAAHQDYMRRNPDAPYIVINDKPKVEQLKRRFPQFWKD